MKNINWRDCSTCAGGGNVGYEVLITIVDCHRRDGDKPHEHRAMSVTFRNGAFDYIKEQGFTFSIISQIQPNSTRIYFDFLHDDYYSRKIGRKLSSIKNAYTLRFPLKTKTEYDVLSGYWVGEYKLEFDRECGYHYIETPQVKETLLGWRK